MFRKFLCASALMVSVAAGAQAQDSTFSAGLGIADFDGAEFTTASVRYGHFFDENWGFEGEAMFGLGDDTVNILSTDVDVSMDYAIGGFGVYRVASSDNFNFLFRAGYVHAEISADANGFEVSEDDGAFAAGLAAETFWDDRNGVRFDYTWANYDEAASFWGVSYVRRFGG
ncbi:porin family protein [Maricaulis sp.]|uniref:porin family protein n=1 Tax=Maricaulis sp. TaxID=1486257 RepID=UPI00262F9CB8|nr:porin family protein [Maricaulis sp.]